MDDLEYKIELVRKELLKTAEERGLSSDETVKLSVELDHLMNAYSYVESDPLVNSDGLEVRAK